MNSNCTEWRPFLVWWIRASCGCRLLRFGWLKVKGILAGREFCLWNQEDQRAGLGCFCIGYYSFVNSFCIDVTIKKYCLHTSNQAPTWPSVLSSSFGNLPYLTAPHLSKLINRFFEKRSHSRIEVWENSRPSGIPSNSLWSKLIPKAVLLWSLCKSEILSPSFWGWFRSIDQNNCRSLRSRRIGF